MIEVPYLCPKYCQIYPNSKSVLSVHELSFPGMNFHQDHAPLTALPE